MTPYSTSEAYPSYPSSPCTNLELLCPEVVDLREGEEADGLGVGVRLGLGSKIGAGMERVKEVCGGFAEAGRRP